MTATFDKPLREQAQEIAEMIKFDRNDRDFNRYSSEMVTLLQWYAYHFDQLNQELRVAIVTKNHSDARRVPEQITSDLQIFADDKRPWERAVHIQSLFDFELGKLKCDENGDIVDA